MRQRLAVVLSGLTLAASLHGAGFQAQAPASLPQTYSFTLDPAMSILGPGVTIRVQRDGVKELIEQTMTSPSLPTPNRLRILYDFGLHRMYTTTPSDPSVPCGVATTTDTKVQLDFDPISSAKELLDQVLQGGQKPTSVSADTAAGIAAKRMDYAWPPSAGGKAQIWVAADGNYPLKAIYTGADGKPQTLFEMKQLSFAKPPASTFTVPAGCGEPTGTYTSANGVSTGSQSASPASGGSAAPGAKLARITGVKVQASTSQYTGSCAPGRMQLVGTIAADGAGTVWYRFRFAGLTFGSGAQAAEGTIIFSRAGTQTVTKDVTFTYDAGTRISNEGGYFSAAMQDSAGHHPLELNSENANYNITCTAAAASAPSATTTSAAGPAKGAVTGVSMPLPIRINAGGPAQRDTAGVLWEADKGFNGGTPYQNTNAPVVPPATGGKAPNLFQTERYSETEFNYAFAVPNGKYSVRLRFAEIYVKNAGERVMNVDINDKRVLDHFDIVAAAKGQYIPVDKEFQVDVTGGTLVIHFAKVTQNPKVNAIEIIKIQ